MKTVAPRESICNLRKYFSSSLTHLINPFHDAVYMEAVSTSTPDYRAIVPRSLAFRATAVKSNSANATCVVIGDPAPEIL